MRRCVGCMESKPKQELIRIVAVSGKPVIDPTGKSAGRGVYLCKDIDCFEKAKKKKTIQRGLSIDGLGPDELDIFKSDFERRFE